MLPDSGWITVSIRSPEEAERAIELFRMAYERATRARRSGDGASVAPPGAA